ncbi:hypothetical protein F5144DRAFT_205387 [Chaetomium tenue]|uniref:Uncharacterized protein n=1 Tax=Chaetomium tenue TaxID=1854479 RepID=A0ACB7PHC4_9PEZI|nr:hypothetical protein F5144DRAFT_205387 [Chaetomium globosum]
MFQETRAVHYITLARLLRFLALHFFCCAVLLRFDILIGYDLLWAARFHDIIGVGCDRKDQFCVLFFGTMDGITLLLRFYDRRTGGLMITGEFDKAVSRKRKPNFNGGMVRLICWWWWGLHWVAGWLLCGWVM